MVSVEEMAGWFPEGRLEVGLCWVPGMHKVAEAGLEKAVGHSQACLALGREKRPQFRLMEHPAFRPLQLLRHLRSECTADLGGCVRRGQTPL